MDHVARYLPTIKALAEQALDMAVDASPIKPREGEFVQSLKVAIPCARAMLGHAGQDITKPRAVLVEAFEEGSPRFADGFGHCRLTYHFLLFDLVVRAWPLVHPEFEVYLPFELPKSDGQIHHDWLHEMCDRRLMAALVTWGPVQGEGPLHAMASDDTPDTWVYRELVGIHGAFGTFVANSYDEPGEIARRAARYHLHHTQPDYTTYQPWALAAFLWFPETVSFAEQQLHDVQTHLSIEGAAGALVPGLLLADAYATLTELLEKTSK